MQPSDYRMFSDEIERLEAEGLELQQQILTQTERLRLIQQRINALQSVVSGSGTRLAASLDTAENDSRSAEEQLRLERSTLTTSLFGMQRSHQAESSDLNQYRAMATPSVRHRVNARTAKPNTQNDKASDSIGTTGESRPGHVDKAL